MQILYAYNPKSRQEDQIESKQALYSVKQNVIYKEVGENTEYEEEIKRLWELGDPFIICEQDIVPTQKDIDELEQCQHPFCASKYLLYPKTTGLKEPVCAHRNVIKGSSGIIYETKWVSDLNMENMQSTDYTSYCKIPTTNFVNESDQFCDLFGFGLTKITPKGKYPIALIISVPCSTIFSPVIVFYIWMQMAFNMLLPCPL